MSVAAVVRAGPEAGLGDRLWCGWLCASVGSLQSWDDISGGRGTGRGSLRDTVERRLPVHGHLQELGHKVGSCLGLLDSISLHDSALLVQAQIPGPSRTALAIESRGVQDIVILKDALLKATLSCEMRRAVEQPLSVHGHVVTQLGTLDGDYSQPHRDQVEVGERAGVLWGALDAPVGIRLEVETLAAEQFGDDAFELRFWTGTTRQPSQLSSPEACSRSISRYPLVGGTTLSLRVGLQPCTVSEFLIAEGPLSP